MPNDFEILIMQGPDHETPIAEIFFKNIQWASIFEDEGHFKIQLFPCPASDFWEFSLNESLIILQKAQKKLSGS